MKKIISQRQRLWALVPRFLMEPRRDLPRIAVDIGRQASIVTKVAKDKGFFENASALRTMFCAVFPCCSAPTGTVNTNVDLRDMRDQKILGDCLR